MAEEETADNIGLTASPSANNAPPDSLNSASLDPAVQRRYAFACNRCKRRKTRCGGERPTCRRCARAHETCHYPQHIPYAEERLKQAQARIKDLETALDAATSAPSVSQPAPASVHDHHISATSSLTQDAQPDAAGQLDESISPHVGLDESGHVTYHGSTSRFHASPIAHPQPASSADLRASLYARHKPALQSNVELLRHVWQPLLQTQTEAELGLPPGLANTLLEIYWTWQHPLHNCVYKPCKP
jgi:hypothetical protein